MVFFYKYVLFYDLPRTLRGISFLQSMPTSLIYKYRCPKIIIAVSSIHFSMPNVTCESRATLAGLDGWREPLKQTENSPVVACTAAVRAHTGLPSSVG